MKPSNRGERNLKSSKREEGRETIKERKEEQREGSRPSPTTLVKRYNN